MRDQAITVIGGLLLAGLVFALGVTFWGASGGTPSAPAGGPTFDGPAVAYDPVPEAQRFHGLALQIHNSDMLDQFKAAIREIAATGADTVLLSTAAYQEHGASSNIMIDARRAPNREQMTDLVKLAKSLRLKVIVMPILLLDKPRGNEWRGKIVPEDPDRWWADYREFIKYYARAASDGGADVLMVGSELNKMEPFVERWRNLIRFIRGQNAGLKLAYSSNWDRYWKVGYWDDLDIAGVTTYYTLADHEEPTVDEIRTAWTKHADQLAAWQRTVGKPVLFAEVGYFSRKGVASQPWNYYHNQGKPSELEQANLYEAFVRVWGDRHSQYHRVVGGIIFWEWTLGAGGPTDETYTPKGKQAEKVMREYFSRTAHKPPVATTAPDDPGNAN